MSLQRLAKIVLSLFISLSSLAHANYCSSVYLSKFTQAKNDADELQKMSIDWRDTKALSAKAKEIQDQLVGNLKDGCSIGFRFCAKLAASTPGIIWRSARFDPSIEDIRERIILPLAKHIRNLKDPKIDLNEAQIQMTIFGIEMALTASVTASKLAPQLTIDAVSGMISLNPGKQPEIVKQAMLKVLKAVYKGIMNRDPNLSISENFTRVFDLAMVDVKNELSTEFGIPQLTEALQLPERN